MIYGCTGHRPLKIPRYDAARLRQFARAEIHALDPYPTKFVSGFALGWDQACGWACVDLGIPLIAAIPCRGQDAKWSPEARADYAALLNCCADVKVVEPGEFANWKLIKRNRWIVNNVQALVALWNGLGDGGSAMCVRYAESVGKPVTNVYERWRALAGGPG